jgi:soluble lytic murein transglycosylase
VQDWSEWWSVQAMKASKAWLAAWLMISAIAVQAAVDVEQQRERFRAGWAAAERGDHAGMLDAIDAIDGYVLKPYLQFELLRQRVDSVPTEVMTRFLARYRDWSFADRLERAWLRSLGERARYRLVLEHADDPGDIEVRCHLARARIELGRTDGLADVVRELWLAGRSRPDACDPAFRWWRRQGNPDVDTAWRRFRLAVEAGETGLAAYLRRYLPETQRVLADRWLTMADDPARALRAARQWRGHGATLETVAWGLKRLARSDWQRAAAAWQSLDDHFDWPEARRGEIEREIALFRAVALDRGAVAAIDALPADERDEQMLAWRARAALGHGLWEEVLASIERMPLAQQAESRWRYWRGRALEQLGRADALLAFASLSAETEYYGFLAATRLDQPLALCEEPVTADPAVQRRLMRDAEFRRVLELFHVGLPWHGRWTWRQLSRRLIDREIEQAALIAAGDGWHHLAISALNQAGRWRAYPWRFPMLAKGEVIAEARRYGVDPALVYGLMRAESAMQVDARSPAGALGLLQLMPQTARAVARRNGLPYRGATSLEEPDVNVPLGVAHLAELQRDFDGNWVQVAAAYNAGPNAVKRWLDERPGNPPDVWIETMPYYETRDYVPRVLAFATLYEWQLDRQPQLLAREVKPGSGAPGRFACPP